VRNRRDGINVFYFSNDVAQKDTAANPCDRSIVGVGLESPPQ